jgi:hypothetical protein
VKIIADEAQTGPNCIDHQNHTTGPLWLDFALSKRIVILCKTKTPSTSTKDLKAI